MRCFAALILLSIAYTVLAFPDKRMPPALERDGPLNMAAHPWLGNGDGARRSPCPFLNAAANHNVLPYSGEGIPHKALMKLLNKAGVDSWIGKILMRGIKKLTRFIRENVDPSHPEDTINLDDLSLHNHIEHDISLTRYDVVYTNPQLPDDHKAAPELIDELVAVARAHNTTKHGATSYLDVVDWSVFRQKRYADEKSMGNVPEFGLGSPQQASGAECVFTFHVLGRDGIITEADFLSFFRDERFPVGWKPAKLNVVEFLLGLVKCQFLYATPEKVLMTPHKIRSLMHHFKKEMYGGSGSDEVLEPEDEQEADKVLSELKSKLSGLKNKME